MNLIINKALLFDYFSGQASVLQQQMIEEWVKDPRHEELFYEYLHEWELAKPAMTVDTDLALLRYKSSINNPDTRSPISNEAAGFTTRKTHFAWWKAAACFAVFVLFLYAFHERIINRIYHTDFGKTMSLVLSDGSSVVLNSNSTLTVPRWGFRGEARKVQLAGEAKFSIVHTADHKRFLVETDSDFKVEVLGTEFNVFARRNSYKVALIKGKVRVKYKGAKRKNELIMTPGEIVSLKKGNVKSKKVSNPEKYTEWQNQKMLFESTPMAEVVAILEDNYGLKVKIRDKHILNQTITGSFRAKSADDFLLALSEILEINVIRTEDNVILIDN